METSTDRQDAFRFWGLGTSAVSLCAASAFSYFCYMGQGIVVGDLLGLRGREAHVAIAQRRGIYWLVASVCCLAGSGITGALVTPIYEDASRLPRFIARFVLASIISIVLTVLIGLVLFSIITASHKAAVPSSPPHLAGFARRSRFIRLAGI
jgi:hypothetical protein